MLKDELNWQQTDKIDFEIKKCELQILQEILRKLLVEIAKIKKPQNQKDLGQNIKNIRLILTKLQNKDLDYPISGWSDSTFFGSVSVFGLGFDPNLMITINCCINEEVDLKIEVNNHKKTEIFYSSTSENPTEAWQQLLNDLTKIGQDL